MGSPSEVRLDLFRKTYFGTTLPLILSFLVSELYIRFLSLCLRSGVSFFPAPDSLLFVLWHNIQTLPHLCDFPRIPGYIKKLRQRGHREISQVFSILSRNLLLIVASNIFVSTVFLYLKMLCHPSLRDTNPFPFVPCETNANEPFCNHCIFRVFYRCISWWA